MKVFINPERSTQVIATIAIGDEYYTPWKRYAFPTWKKYCERHGLGLIVFDTDLIPKDSPIWKKPTWQKLLIGETVKRTLPAVTEVCYGLSILRLLVRYWLHARGLRRHTQLQSLSRRYHTVERGDAADAAAGPGGGR